MSGVIGGQATVSFGRCDGLLYGHKARAPAEDVCGALGGGSTLLIHYTMSRGGNKVNRCELI